MRCPYLALKIRPYLAFWSSQPSRGLLFSLYSLSLEVRSTCPPLVRTREPFAGSVLCGCRSLHGLILPVPVQEGAVHQLSLRVLETRCRFAFPGLTLCLDADCSPLPLLEPWASVCRLWVFPKESERGLCALSHWFAGFS